MPIAKILGTPHTFDLSTPTAAFDAHGSAPAAAETLVFIHGWLLSRAYWQPMVAQLQERYRCLTYDMRGFGESVQSDGCVQRDGLNGLEEDAVEGQRRPAIRLPDGQSWYPSEATDEAPKQTGDAYHPSTYSLAAYAQDLGELLDALGLEEPVWLVGHSLGGSVALWAAYLFPERIKGVICVNAGGGIYIPKEFEKFRSAGEQMVKFRPGWLPSVPLLPRVFTRAMVHKTLDIRWGKQRIQDFVCADSAAASGALLESTTPAEVHQLPKLVGALSQPVHFITATQDSIMLPRYVNYLASFHPDFGQKVGQKGSQADGEQAAMVSEIPDCGHMAMVEQPVAAVQIIDRVVGRGTGCSIGCSTGRGTGSITADATDTVLQSP